MSFLAGQGIAGTLAQGVRACEMRRATHGDLAKTYLQHVLTAAAMNVVRVVHELNDRPLAPTLFSSFTARMRSAA